MHTPNPTTTIHLEPEREQQHLRDYWVAHLYLLAHDVAEARADAGQVAAARGGLDGDVGLLVRRGGGARRRRRAVPTEAEEPESKQVSSSAGASCQDPASPYEALALSLCSRPALRGAFDCVITRVPWAPLGQNVFPIFVSIVFFALKTSSVSVMMS